MAAPDPTTTAPRTLSVAEGADQLRALGVQRGGVLVVHTSFRAVRPVQGGPAGLIEALRAALGPAGTLVMPSMGGDDNIPFDPATSPPAEDLGVLPDTFWRQPGVLRSSHPHAFAAAGPRAAEIVAGALPFPPHGADSPVGHAHDLDAQVLLLGVGHDANTTLHLAEAFGQVPYGVPYHVTVVEDGRPRRVEYLENDHCCELFGQLDGWLRARRLQAEGRVGYAWSRLTRARDVVRVALEHLRDDPLVFLHPPGAGCEECDLARASVPA